MKRKILAAVVVCAGTIIFFQNCGAPFTGLTSTVGGAARGIASLGSVAAEVPIPPEMRGKIFVGYQGWFRTPLDADFGKWWHYANMPLTSGPGINNLGIDYWPDVSEYPASTLLSLQNPAAQASGPILTLGNGAPTQLFTSESSGTTDVHMKWMRDYGIEGAFVQRFVSDLPYAGTAPIQLVQKSAEAYQRKFVTMYDISTSWRNPDCYKNGAAPDPNAGSSNPNFSIAKCVENDWNSLVAGGLVASPSYLRVTTKGSQKPLVVLWGFGLNTPSPNGSPGGVYIYNTADAMELIQWFHNQGVAVMGGTPTSWVSQTGDSLSDASAAAAARKAGQAWPSWTEVYKAFDIISPWMVGRVSTPTDIDNYVNGIFQADLSAVRQNGQGYLPVVFPGYSFYNTAHAALGVSGTDPSFPMNQVPRSCGDFLWKQFLDEAQQGASSYYIAMFDEMNEGTSIFKMAPNAQTAPNGISILTLDVDGCNIPSDWYLQVTHQMANVVASVANLTEAMPLPIPPKNYNIGVQLGSAQSLTGPGIKLTMQGDGNLVLYDTFGKPLWSSGTSGKCAGNCSMTFQGDGNLVLASAGSPYWSAGTGVTALNGYTAARLVLTHAPPYVQIQDASALTLWSTTQAAIRGSGLAAPPIAAPPVAAPPVVVAPPVGAPVAASCSLNGVSIASGQSVTTYQSASVPYGLSCSAQTRTCSSGSLSGSFTATSCSAQGPQSCNFNGQVVAHGTWLTAYQSASASFCSSEARYCNNGSLTGSYPYASCTVTAPPPVAVTLTPIEIFINQRYLAVFGRTTPTTSMTYLENSYNNNLTGCYATMQAILHDDPLRASAQNVADVDSNRAYIAKLYQVSFLAPAGPGDDVAGLLSERLNGLPIEQLENRFLDNPRFQSGCTSLGVRVFPN